MPENTAIAATRFSITVDGYEIAPFVELTGLGGLKGEAALQSTAAPGKRVSTLMLSRHQGNDLKLAAWCRSAQGQGAAARKNCILTVHGSDDRSVKRYYLTQAWPSKIEISGLGLKAGSSMQPMETVTIVAERIQRVPV